MEINGIPFENNGMKNINGKTTRNVSSSRAEIRKYSETAGVSDSASGIDRVDETTFVVEPEFQPRTELLEEVSRRIERGEYNAPDVRDAIAGKVVGSLDTEESASNSPEGAVRADRVSEVADTLGNTSYDTPDVIRETAARIVSALGLDSIFGSDGTG